MSKASAFKTHRLSGFCNLLAVLLGTLGVTSAAVAEAPPADAEFGAQRLSQWRYEAIASPATQSRSSTARFGSMTPAERRAAVDAYWGDGLPTAEKLRIFDTYWDYADRKYAAFQNLLVDWPAMRARYRGKLRRA